ncbi:serine/threonine-protein kinase [Polyangium sorediatum]|uniref:Serine/threonine-protein kinase n=1 Tax=Polyangium sorediatum TaxID=889274 RepID=A0ABT6NZX8_9BACT|nr:serine/threonine-protein kinase [Polyangium sorediatum]MDI1433902.1 serine/threonine-protein kinase [Polyangium sorediatum]
MTLQPGNTIEGKYRIVRLLGQGGMGAVYEGENERIHRRVAIKVLHASVSGKEDVVQRFEREAQAAGRIGSEHIVEVLDLGNLPSGERFMVMEFLDGQSLGDRIKKRKRLTPQELAPLIHGMLEGLAAAHDAGIVHRDLKPDNVYLINNKNQRDFVKILDFGVSKFSALDTDMSMTKTGAVMGTPYYMSPEQARGGKIDARSDLYSVGVVMYQAITGRLPFQAQTFNELVFKIALESPDPAELVVPNLDPNFAAIIAKAMIRDANVRFQTAREFQAAVAQWMMANPAGPELSAGRIPTIQPGMFDPRMSQQNPLVGTGPLGLPAGFDPRMSQQNPLVGTGQLGLPAGFDPRMSQQNPMVMGQQPIPGTSLGMSHPNLGMSHPGLTVAGAPPKSGNGAMVAIGLLGTLLVAASGLIVWKFVLDKPAPGTPPAMTTQAAATQPPPMPTPTPTLAPTPTAAATEEAPTPADTNTAAVGTTTPPIGVGGPLPTGARTSNTAPSGTGTGTGKKPPTPTTTATSTGGRKMGSDL